jgi:acetyl esterase
MRLGLTQLIDPRLGLLVEGSREFYAHRVAGRGPANRSELTAVRKIAADAASARPALPVVEIDREGGGSVSVRIHSPSGGPARAVLLDIHGGGFYMGTASDGDVRNSRLLDVLGVAVVSVEYRLAPEHPWPAAVDDCETAALWLADNALDRFGSASLGIIGFSAGATLAVSTLRRMRARGVRAYEAAVLQFGTYDLSARTPAGRLIAEEYFLEAYAGGVADRTDPDLSPIYADLDVLPPILMVIGTADILLQDNLAMAARLSAAGVDVDLRVYPEAPHGFTGHATPMGQAAFDDITDWLGGHLG